MSGGQSQNPITIGEYRIYKINTSSTFRQQVTTMQFKQETVLAQFRDNADNTFITLKLKLVDWIQKEGDNKIQQLVAKINQEVAKIQRLNDNHEISIQCSEFFRRMRGIVNTGNSCFMNSTIQMLFYCSQIRSQIMSLNSGGVLKVLKDVMVHLEKGLANYRDEKQLKKLECQFRKGKEQKDSYEYFLQLVRTLSLEDGFKQNVRKLFEIRQEYTLQCLHCNKPKQINQQMILTCNVYPTKKNNSVLKCLKREQQGGQCSCHKKLKESQCILNSPQYLFVHINWNNDSPTFQVDPELGLDTKTERCNYKILGMVRHYGSQTSGHYVFIKKEEQSWVELSDQYIKEWKPNKTGRDILVAYQLKSHTPITTQPVPYQYLEPQITKPVQKPATYPYLNNAIIQNGYFQLPSNKKTDQAQKSQIKVPGTQNVSSSNGQMHAQQQPQPSNTTQKGSQNVSSSNSQLPAQQPQPTNTTQKGSQITDKQQYKKKKYRHNKDPSIPMHPYK